jgi:hypothetical protein
VQVVGLGLVWLGHAHLGDCPQRMTFMAASGALPEFLRLTSFNKVFLSAFTSYYSFSCLQLKISAQKDNGISLLPTQIGCFGA